MFLIVPSFIILYALYAADHVNKVMRNALFLFFIVAPTSYASFELIPAWTEWINEEPKYSQEYVAKINRDMANVPFDNRYVAVMRDVTSYPEESSYHNPSYLPPGPGIALPSYVGGIIPFDVSIPYAEICRSNEQMNPNCQENPTCPCHINPFKLWCDDNQLSAKPEHLIHFFVDNNIQRFIAGAGVQVPSEWDAAVRQIAADSTSGQRYFEVLHKP